MTDTKHYRLFSDLIKISVGNIEAFSEVPTIAEWDKLYNEANRQAVSGVLLEGVKRLPENQRPPRQMLMNWFSTVQQIMSVNRQVDKDTLKITQKWSKVGYRNIILKGQANAQLYPIPLTRVSGDIDVWVDAPRGEVINYIRKMFPKEEVTWIEMNFPVLKSTLVEVHFEPTYLYDPFTNRRLSKYLKSRIEFIGEMEIEGGKIPVLDKETNLVFQLTHIYRHLFFEGVGMRQIMDLYYLLQQDGITDTFPEVRKILKSIRLEHFTAGLMWIMRETFGMEEAKMILAPNEAEGRFLLSEIMMSGNFGHDDDRVGNRAEMNRWQRLTWGTKWALRLIGHYPREVMWHPIYRISQYLWRVKNGYL